MKTSIYNIRPTFAREMTISYLMEKFSKSFDKTSNGCWEWRKGLNKDGYSQISLWGGWKKAPKGGQYPAHRIMYELIKGELKPDEQIDHLCRNKVCINPEHLEAVDKDTNNIRGNSPSAIHSRKTQCPKGHPYSGANLYIEFKQNGKTMRRCRACRAEQKRQQYLRSKLKEANYARKEGEDAIT